MKFGIIAVFALILASCSSPTVLYDYDSTVNFQSYKTYNIYPIQDSLLTASDQKAIVETLNDSLQSYGLKEKLIPDFRVNVYADQYQTVSSNYTGVQVGMFSGFAGLGASIPATAVKNKFSLTIEFVDGLTKSLFWQAVVETSQSKMNNQEERLLLFDELISAALKKYPGFYPELVED
ncbi:DUF4136 domain-containing protein [Psychroflexus salarius]|nr:DUF4136 domain-containing protein [Psychroflexus salarius]